MKVKFTEHEVYSIIRSHLIEKMNMPKKDVKACLPKYRIMNQGFEGQEELAFDGIEITVDTGDTGHPYRS